MRTSDLNKQSNWSMILIAAVSVLMIIWFGYTVSKITATMEKVETVVLPTPVEPEPIAFDFAGMKCTTFQREPTFTYSTSNQTVTFLVECHPDIMIHYFEAEVPDEE